MIHNEVLRPPTLMGDADKKTQQMYRYLHALAEQIQNVFDSIEDSSMLLKKLEQQQKEIDELKKALGTKANRAALTDTTKEVEDRLDSQQGQLDSHKTIIDKHGQDIIVNARDIEVNARDIEVNARDIEVNARDIEVNARDIEVNARNITTQAERIDVQAEQLNVQANNIAIQGENIVKLQAGVDENKSAITLTEGKIEAQAKEIALKADKIDLQGYVTMQDFEALEGEVDNLFASDLIVHGGLSADSITAGEGDFDDLKFGTLAGDNVEWKSQYVVTGAGTVTQDKRYLNLMLADGTTAAVDIVTNVAFSQSGAYINFLGKQG